MWHWQTVITLFSKLHNSIFHQLIILFSKSQNSCILKAYNSIFWNLEFHIPKLRILYSKSQNSVFQNSEFYIPKLRIPYSKTQNFISPNSEFHIQKLKNPNSEAQCQNYFVTPTILEKKCNNSTSLREKQFIVSKLIIHMICHELKSNFHVCHS